ncbi:MAG TPA: metal-dependent transcriptional regulator [Candidatus Altiarchaeales archaeon]|nr:metal-dependent transcriptional regulator [Candidatus Altiarchaeales archaeon]
MPTNYSKSVEDYLEAVYILSEQKGYARSKDVSRHLRVSTPSVSEMLVKLKKLGLINHEPYSPIQLTQTGEQSARAVKTRHDTLTKFFRILQVDEKTATCDACEIEHDLSPQTLAQLTKFVGFVEAADNPCFIDRFSEYCRTGKHTCKKTKKQ